MAEILDIEFCKKLAEKYTGVPLNQLKWEPFVLLEASNSNGKDILKLEENQIFIGEVTVCNRETSTVPAAFYKPQVKFRADIIEANSFNVVVPELTTLPPITGAFQWIQCDSADFVTDLYLFGILVSY